MPNDNLQAPPRVLSRTPHRVRVSAVLFTLIVMSSIIAAVMVSRDGDDSSSPSSPRLPANGVSTTTATTISTRTEITSRLRQILKVRDTALLARDADLLSGIYTIDCECLEDGRTLIRRLRKERIVWKGVRTDVAIKSTEEVNDRLWIVVATISTPTVRIETESGRLVRIVPPERNLVRFALAKPKNEEGWLLGHASTFER